MADNRVNPNIADQIHNMTAVSWAAESQRHDFLELLLADDRTIRTAPAGGGAARAAYDAALAAVTRRAEWRTRNARFRGLTRAMVAFGRMRYRAALVVYEPGGAGWAAAATHFSATAASREHDGMMEDMMVE